MAASALEGIAPDIPCTLDSTDVARGRDTLLERARQLLHNPEGL